MPKRQSLGNDIQRKRVTIEVFVYDSMLRLSEKDNRLRVSYPPELAEIACKLRRPTGNLFFTVHEVQQQAEGFDCGLFAIANAAAVCEGIEPGTVTYNQKLMRPALIHSIQTDDISSFVKTISKSVPTGNPQQPLYQWEVKVYCTCRLPPDGRPMVECTECKQWFHEHCVSGDIVGQTWTCTACTDKL